MLSNTSFQVSVPGSTMLLGEHAVLHQYPAMVCAVNRRLTVSLTPRQDQKIFIHSDILDEYTTDIYSLESKKPFHFILEAVKHYQKELPSGFDLSIASEFSDKVGLGSSAAVTVGTLGVLQQWVEKNRAIDLFELYRIGLSVVRQVQGTGSGADVAASVFGGVVYYRQDPVEIQKIGALLPIHLVYSGYKMPTAEVIKRVNTFAEKQPELFKNIYARIGECVDLGLTAIKKQDWDLLGKVFYQHQALQAALGVSDEILGAIINRVKELSSVYGAKISGAGLGDCVIVLGDLPDDYFPLNDEQRNQGISMIPVSVDPDGILF